MKFLIPIIGLILYPLLTMAMPPSPIMWGANNTAVNTASGGLSLNGTAFVNAPGSFLNFDSGALSAITTNQMIGLGKTARAMKFENAAAFASAFTCTTNPTLTIYDCGTAVTTGCTASQTSTMGTLTLTGSTTEVDASITTANIAASHYWAVLVTAGACTVLNIAGSIESGMQ